MTLNVLTALYSDLDIEYSQVMSGPYRNFVHGGEDCQIIAGLKDGRLSGFWRPMVSAGSKKSLKRLCEILWDVSSKDWYYMDFLVDGELSAVSKFLLGKGYKARLVFTQVIDLTKTEEQLHADLRKSYTSLVNKESGGIAAPSGIFSMKALHKQLKGNSRPEETWYIQHKMLQAGQAFLSANIDSTSWALIYHNEYCAYYASGCSEGNAHPVLWRAITHARKLGLSMFEMGEQVHFEGQRMMDGKPATAKDVNIAKFKAGFGGRTKTRLILEKP